MDQRWSELNKKMQKEISKEATFNSGIETLLELRKEIFQQITQIVNEFPENAFYLMPFAGADGYHSKTLSYSIWHIFRIEDIVAHEIIVQDQQILFHKNYLDKIKSPIITTGNELQNEKIMEFSKILDINQLYSYAEDVMKSTDEILCSLEFKELKRKFGKVYEQRLKETKCVSEDKEAVWLIEYWCSKNLAGLIKMPFSRHWIMHVEAMRRIKNRLEKNAVN